MESDLDSEHHSSWRRLQGLDLVDIALLQVIQTLTKYYCSEYSTRKCLNKGMSESTFTASSKAGIASARSRCASSAIAYIQPIVKPTIQIVFCACIHTFASAAFALALASSTSTLAFVSAAEALSRVISTIMPDTYIYSHRFSVILRRLDACDVFVFVFVFVYLRLSLYKLRLQYNKLLNGYGTFQINKLTLCR